MRVRKVFNQFNFDFNLYIVSFNAFIFCSFSSKRLSNSAQAEFELWIRSADWQPTEIDERKIDEFFLENQHSVPRQRQISTI